MCAKVSALLEIAQALVLNILRSRQVCFTAHESVFAGIIIAINYYAYPGGCQLKKHGGIGMESSSPGIFLDNGWRSFLIFPEACPCAGCRGRYNRTHLNIPISVRGRGDVLFQTPDIGTYFENLKIEANKDIGAIDNVEIGSNINI